MNTRLREYMMCWMVECYVRCVFIALIKCYEALKACLDGYQTILLVVVVCSVRNIHGWDRMGLA